MPFQRLLFSLAEADSHRHRARTLLSRCRPIPACFSERRRGISPVSWQSSCSFALLSDPGQPCASRSFCRGAGVVPPRMKRRTPTICHFSGLNRTALALAVYASCPPLDGLRNTRFRLADLPLPDGYRTRWTAIERFSFQMFYVISLPPRSQVLSGRDTRRDGGGDPSPAASGAGVRSVPRWRTTQAHPRARASSGMRVADCIHLNLQSVCRYYFPEVVKSNFYRRFLVFSNLLSSLSHVPSFLKSGMSS